MRPLLDLTAHLPAAEFRPYRPVLEAFAREGVPFALGGGHAFAAYSGRWRDTKDLDVYVVPAERDRAVAVLEQEGFVDLFDEMPYERHWIFRGRRDGRILDVIYRMANARADVDEGWLEGGPSIELHGSPLRLLPLAELTWAKLYVLQPERSDWPDLLNLLHLRAGEVDWAHLLRRVGDDCRLLGGLLAVLDWLSPAAAARVPAMVWGACGVERSSGVGDEARSRDRVAALDTRDWFGPRDLPDEGSSPEA